MIEFTSDDLIDHFEHKKQDPSAEVQCKICAKLDRVRRNVPGLKELVDTGKITKTKEYNKNYHLKNKKKDDKNV